MCLPVDLVRDAAFLAMGTAWVLNWEKQQWMVAHLPVVFWQVEWIEVMKVIMVGGRQVILKWLGAWCKMS